MLAIALLALALDPAPTEPPAEPAPAAIRAAVERSVPLIQRSLAEYARRRDCFSCHHQALGLLALTTARGRGLEVDGDLIGDQSAFVAADLSKAADGYRQGRSQGGGATRAGYALWALQLGGHPPDATTSAVAGFLLKDGREGWRTTSRRPPSEASPFTATFVALNGLRAFADPAAAERTAERVANAREWLLRTPAEDTEGRVFRLRGLLAADADAGAVRAAAGELAASQRPDGGWSQTEDRESDAYATGTALVALLQAGRLIADDPDSRRGLAFLIRSQQADGSWHVVSRSRPFQAYFESGFPHGKDQFLSMAATGWATTALASALPPGPHR